MRTHDAMNASPSRDPAPGSSNRLFLWIVLAVVGTGLVAMIVVGALGYYAIRQLTREAERGRTMLGRQVAEPAWGIAYQQPYGLPRPKRTEESIRDSGTLGHQLALETEDLYRSCSVDVTYYPSGLVDDRPPRKVLAQVCDDSIKEMSARVLQVREITHQGHPGLEYRLSIPNDGEQAYCRMRALSDPNRLIRVWFIATSSTAVDVPAVEGFFNSLRITPVSRSLKAAARR
jgi:hypothetical protein